MCGGREGERDLVYASVYVRESLCACACVNEWKREIVGSLRARGRKCVCVSKCVCVCECVYICE